MRIDPALRAQKIRQWNVPVWWPLWLLGALGLAAIGLIWRVAQQRDRRTALAAAAIQDGAQRGTKENQP